MTGKTWIDRRNRRDIRGRTECQNRAERPDRTIRVLQFYRAKERHEHSMEEMMDAVNRYLESKGDGPHQNPDGKEEIPELEIQRFYLPFGSYRNPGKMLWNIITAIAAFLIYRPDVCHITGEVTFLGCILPGKRTIITFHDFVYLDRWKSAGLDNAADKVPERNEVSEMKQERDECREKAESPNEKAEEALVYAISYFFWHWIPLRRCAAIVCVSNTIRDEMVRRFPFTESKITVIPNTLGESFEKILDECSEPDGREYISPEEKMEPITEKEETNQWSETSG